MTDLDPQTHRNESIRDILRAAGLDTTDDVLLAGVRQLAADRKALIDANGELAEECRRLNPLEAEVLVLREQLDYMRDLVKTAIVQAGIAEQTREHWSEALLREHGPAAAPRLSWMWGEDRTAGEWWLVECRNGEPHRAYHPDHGEKKAWRDTFSRWHGAPFDDGTWDRATVTAPTEIVHMGGGGGGARGHMEYRPAQGHGTKAFSDRANPFGVVRRANGALEPVQFELRAHDDRYVTTEPLVLSADDRLYLQPPPPRTKAPSVDIRRALTIVAAYIDPSAPFSYGRFVELLATVPGLEELSYSVIYPVLFNVQACTHPKSAEIDNLALVSDCSAYGREICAEFGIHYVPVCTCIDFVGESANHGVFCPKKDRP